MFIFVGLGNPDLRYLLTRHNIGWLFVDFCLTYLKDKTNSFEHKSKLDSQISVVKLPQREIILVKPMTYMNESGKAVNKIINYYHLDPLKQLFLIHDDLDISFGDYKISRAKGPKIHNGLNSVVKTIGTENFIRLRIGIANEQLSEIKNKGGSVAEDFVLDEFCQTEQEQLPKIFQQALIELNQYTLG